jgi:hypothetical protein
MSLGSDWQSVERHHTSVPLVTVNDCALVPTFKTHGVAEVFDSRMDSCGFSPWAYSVLSDSASTVMLAAVHSIGPAGTLGVGVAVGPAVGVTAAEGAEAVTDGDAEALLADGSDEGAAVGATRQGGAATSHTTRPITIRARSPAARRRRR